MLLWKYYPTTALRVSGSCPPCCGRYWKAMTIWNADSRSLDSGLRAAKLSRWNYGNSFTSKCLRACCTTCMGLRKYGMLHGTTRREVTTCSCAFPLDGLLATCKSTCWISNSVRNRLEFPENYMSVASDWRGDI